MKKILSVLVLLLSLGGATAHAQQPVAVASIAAGNNNIGDVDVASIAAGNNNIGDVDVVSIIPGTLASNLGKAEDVAHGSGDTGVMALCVRKDTAASLAGTDGDYQPCITASDGSVWVSVANGSTTDANSYAIAASAATATTTAGTLTCYATSAASNNATNCKASAGNVYGIRVINTTTTNYFVRLYNLSSSPTCSSSSGFIETIPALGAAANGGGISFPRAIPQAFSAGIGFCITAGGGSTDNTNAATGVYLSIDYK